MTERKLPVPVSQVLADAPPVRAQQLWERIEAARARRRAQGPARFLGRIALAAAALGLLIWSGFAIHGAQQGQAPLALRDSAALPASLRAGPEGFRTVDLSDGSRITLARNTRLDVLVASPKHVELVLRDGRARFDVRPRGPRAWRIESSGVSVEVVGTSFVVERRGATVNVAVLHGVVVVRGAGLPDGVRRLGAGERAEVAVLANGPAAPGLPAGRVGRVVEAGEPGAALPASSPGAALPASTPGAALASRADDAARSAAVKRTAARSVAAPPSVEALWREVDAARLRGTPHDALAVLARLQQIAPQAEQRALAAFTAGKIALDQLGDCPRAARDLAAALALGLPSPLTVDARTRLVEAHARGGDRAAACAEAALLPEAQRTRALARHCPSGR